MIVFLLLIVVLLIGLTSAAVMGKIVGFMADPASSQSFAGVPEGSMSADDIGGLHFDLGLRGYRMDQVDQVIDALGARLSELENEVRSLSTTSTPASTTAGDPPEVSRDELEQ